MKRTLWVVLYLGDKIASSEQRAHEVDVSNVSQVYHNEAEADRTYMKIKGGLSQRDLLLKFPVEIFLPDILAAD